MADTDEEEDLLKSSDSEDDTIVKENGDEVCDIKEGLQELKKDEVNGKMSADASCINSQSTTINGDDDDDLFKEMNDILEMEPEKVVSLKEDSSNSSSNHTANESLDSSKKTQEITSIVAKQEESSSSNKASKKSSPSTVSDIINSKSGDKRPREAMEDDNDSEELFNKKSKVDTTRSKSPPVDPPTAQSTPIRPIRASTIDSDNNKKLLPIPIEKEEECDFSLLDDDEDDEPTFHTFTLDQFLDLDYSILDDENEENSVLNQTVIEKQPSDALKKDGVANVLSSIEDDKKGADIIPVKNDENKSKPAKANQVNKTHKIKEEYYQKAKEDWKKDIATSGVQFSIPTIYSLKQPQVFTDYRDQRKIIGYESVGEWKDKYHPMWAEYRQCHPNGLSHLIYRKWGLEKTIDITRNLTKFSNRSVQAKSAAKSKAASNSKNSKSANKQVHDTTETKVIENANIMDVMLESVRNEREDEITDLAAAASSANSSLPADKEAASDVSLTSNQTSLAGCRYCTFRCHCSPGRKQKRPYPENCPPYVDDDLKSQPKLLNLPDVQKEVRNYKTTRMNNEESESQLNMFNVVESYANEAQKVIFSSHEVFDLAGFFNKSDYDNHNPTDFTREQVRELLSVENTQDTLRKVYKSAYGGEGYSDEESDSSDSDSELGSVEGEEDKEEWTDRQIEDY